VPLSEILELDIDSALDQVDKLETALTDAFRQSTDNFTQSFQDVGDSVAENIGSGSEKAAVALEAGVGTQVGLITEKFEEFSHKGRSALEQVGVGAEHLGGLFTPLAAAIGATLLVGGESVHTFVRLADQVRHIRDVAGVTATQASELASAFNVMGVQGTITERVLGRFHSQLQSGKIDLGKYGVEVAHLANGNVDTFHTFLNLADAVKSAHGEIDGATITIGLFGQRLGAKLLPLLKEGREGITKLFEGAKDAGLIFTDKQLNQALEFEKASAEVKEQIEGLSVAIGEKLVPVLTAALGRFEDVKGGFDLLTVGVKSVAGPFTAAFTGSEKFHRSLDQSADAAVRAFGKVGKASSEAIGKHLAAQLEASQKLVASLDQSITTASGDMESFAVSVGLPVDQLAAFGNAIRAGTISAGELHTKLHELGLTDDEIDKFAKGVASSMDSFRKSVESTLRGVDTAIQDFKPGESFAEFEKQIKDNVLDTGKFLGDIQALINRGAPQIASDLLKVGPAADKAAEEVLKKRNDVVAGLESQSEALHQASQENLGAVQTLVNQVGALQVDSPDFVGAVKGGIEDLNSYIKSAQTVNLLASGGAALGDALFGQGVGPAFASGFGDLKAQIERDLPALIASAIDASQSPVVLQSLARKVTDAVARSFL
jgi:hypothetical protein